jgi:hopene-associated glycosyltransferase HpnB
MSSDVFLSILSMLALAGWTYLMFFNGSFWRPLTDEPFAPNLTSWPSVDIVVPARNEAETLPQSLPSLLNQDYPGEWRLILVDDHSGDGTAKIAEALSEKEGKKFRLSVVAAPDLSDGWTGKVAAMQAGVGESQSDYILFTDADIRHSPDSLRRLVARSKTDSLDLHSLMVKLRCVSVAEKLLIPAFIFFFALLYPFRRANDPVSKVAAAAGGTMLVKREALDRAGGLAKIKGALIDDCSLAKLIKTSGGKCRLSLTSRVFSQRPYPRFKDIHQMVARTAFTQLRYSGLLLLGTVLGLALLFLVPMASFLAPTAATVWTGILGWLLMTYIYTPTVVFYGLSPFWGFTLPLAACLYLLATVDSARLYWLGKGGQWKKRVQAKK